MIFVFGSINVDLVVNVPNLPNAGETVVGNSYKLIPGGKGANQALAARRAGADVQIIGAVGKDDLSQTATKNLNESGVCLNNVVSLEGTTGLALIGISPEGENQIIVASGVNQQVNPNWLEEAIHESSTLLLQLELSIESVAKAIAIGRKEKCQTILNTAPFNKNVIPYLKDIDVLIANVVEAKDIAIELGISKEPSHFLEEFVSKYNVKLIITLGSEGCIAHDGNQQYKVSPPKVDVIDTTGAGDAFVGCLATNLDNGVEFESALTQATIAGSLACTVIGAQDGAPTLTQINDMYKDYKNSQR